MDISFQIKRRTLLQMVAGGASVSLGVHNLTAAVCGAPLPLTDCAVQDNITMAGPPAWAPTPGQAKWRIDGMHKVLGKKIYARDFHAADMAKEGWPATEQFLFALRCNRNNQIVTGYRLDMLPPELQPSVVIDATVLAAKNVATPSHMDRPFFASIGKAPDYYGQPVAMLLFDSFNTFRRAKQLLQFNELAIQYGASFTHAVGVFNPQTLFVRNDPTQFSHVNNKTDSDYALKLEANTAQVRQDIASKGWRTFSRSFYTPSADPAFMEPESGMGWYDAPTQTLHLLLGTQSPTGDVKECAALFAGSAYPVSKVELFSCYPGGGFGGRDSSYFTSYLAMAAVFASGPLRWSQDRFEQFQTGLKRQETDFSETLALDPNGKIQALDCTFVVNGGGQKNLNPFVAALAALSSASCYDIPQAIARASATQTPQLSGGSQRGFGGPQAYIAIETLLDEAASSLGIDPFALRRTNLLVQGRGKTVTGAPILQDLQLTEMLRRLEESPLWAKRKQRKEELEAQGTLLYGVGFAMSNQAYGTSGDGMVGAVQLMRDGSLLAHTPYIDMGNGAATALGLAPAAWLGRNASHINMGETAMFDALQLSNAPLAIATPRYVLRNTGSSSACLGAFHQFHVVEGAAHALLLQTVLPALNLIWNTHLPASAIRWNNGAAQAQGLPSIAWARVVDMVFAKKLPTVAAVHASVVGSFASASFAFPGGGVRLDLDYVAVGTDPSALTSVNRGVVTNPPALNSLFQRYAYSPCGALVALTVERATGVVKVEQVVSALSAGVLHCLPVVQGQSQGGIAMAMGDVLLGGCPNDESGPGNGSWNFHNYAITKFSDIAQQELIILPAADGETTARGIAESVMCPIAPAILNALAMATQGKRFTHLPVTPAIILEALA